MEGIKELAIAYYERATEEEKDTAREYFQRLDLNGDGKVCLLEFKKSVSSWLSSEKVFKQLDANGEATLDFNDVLAIYYMEKGKLSLSCNGCCDLLLGQFFSCFICLPKFPKSVDLCCDCYRKGEFKHEHSISNFVDHHSLLMWFMSRWGNEERTQEKREMEELDDIAIAHYQAGSQQVQALAHEFFDSMDSDGDGRIDLPEFLAFVRQEGHCHMNNPYFFKELDRDGNGSLDFWEVMTLYYIIKSRRTFCDFCGKFVLGIFSRVWNALSPYAVIVIGLLNIITVTTVALSFWTATHCSKLKKFHHRQHRLILTRKLTVHTMYNIHIQAPVLQQQLFQDIKCSCYYVHHQNPSPSASTAIVPGYKVNKWNVAFKAFEAALAIGNIAGTLCTIL